MIFLESPWPVLFIGIIAEAILALILFKTGRGFVLWMIVGVALLVVGGVLLERFSVTDRKLVARELDGAAAALEANDYNRLSGYISSSAEADSTRVAAQQALNEVTFAGVRVRNLEVTINRLTSPPTAQTSFTALTTASAKHGDWVGEQTHPVGLRVKLRLESGRWRIIGHDIVRDPRDLR